MSIQIAMSVNGRAVTASVQPSMTLVEFIREHLRLTGTHVGCNTSQCGACTVHVNGRAVKSCNMLVVQAQGADVMTIEGLAAASEVSTISGLTAPNTPEQSIQLFPATSPAANPAFDITPARLVTALLTERGFCAANEAALTQLFPDLL